MRTVRFKDWLILIGIAAAVIAVDQLSKAVVTRNLYFGESIPVIPPVFSITLSENTGAAFGFLSQGGNVFLILAIAIVVGIVVFYPRIVRSGLLTQVGVAMVAGGAVGNAIDRLTNGAVIDFIHYTLPGVISNISNLADHAIVLGVVLIVIESFRSDARRRADQATASPPEASADLPEGPA
jgi:signal peptidase II